MNSRKFKLLAMICYEHYYGAEQANLKVLRMMRDCGAEIECIVVRKGGDLLKSALRQEGWVLHETAYGPSWFGIPRNLSHPVKNLIGMMRVSATVRQVIREFRPDYLYVPNYIQYLYLWPALWGKKLPVIFRIGDPPENTKLHRFMWKRLIASHVLHFIANSRYTLERLFKNDIPRDQGLVINNCRPDCQKPPNPHQPGNRTVIYAGQINFQKGVREIVEAAIPLCRKYNDVEFTIWGKADEKSAYFQDMQALIRGSGLTERILFRGFSKNLFPMYQQAVLHLCPSIQQESSANVVIEAKFAGIPSVVFPNGGLPELIEHKVDGYICPEPTSSCLQEGIDYFLADEERCSQAGQKAYVSRENYTEAKIREKWAALFRSQRNTTADFGYRRG